MAQVTIYMDDETLVRMRRAAARSGLSMSAWLASLVRERTRNQWPAEVVELAGAWKDFPAAEDLRATDGVDVEREVL
jgi:hypothetical protein